MNNRLPWVDNTKALGMFLVFWGHLLEKGFFDHSLMHSVYKCIYAFHMPLFFLLAGLFFTSNQHQRFGQLFIHKIKTRLVPVMFFVAVAVPLWIWPKPEAWGMPNDPQILDAAWNLLQGKPTINWTCWFLVSLFVVELVASELIFALQRRWVFFLFLVFLYYVASEITANLTVVATAVGIVPNWWFLQEGTMCLFFYLSGYALRHYWSLLLPSESTAKSIVFCAVSMLLLLLTYDRNFSSSLAAVNMSGADHGNRWWFLASAMTGIFAMMHLARLLPSHHLLTLVGQNTLPLLGINGLFLHFFNAPLWLLVSRLTSEYELLAITFIMALITLLISLPIAVVLNRWAPFLVGRWK